jgi:hypothetical protein
MNVALYMAEAPVKVLGYVMKTKISTAKIREVYKLYSNRRGRIRRPENARATPNRPATPIYHKGERDSLNYPQPA